MKILLVEEIEMEAVKSKILLQVDLENMILKLVQFIKEVNDTGK